MTASSRQPTLFLMTEPSRRGQVSSELQGETANTENQGKGRNKDVKDRRMESYRREK
jgi:hypothetical protein